MSHIFISQHIVSLLAFGSRNKNVSVLNIYLLFANLVFIHFLHPEQTALCCVICIAIDLEVEILRL